jgi:transcriptional regulator with XRE-family HTH domain
MKTTYRIWIGNRLKYFREKLKISQSQLAEKIGMQKRSYGKYEEGEAEPSIYTLKKLCEIFSTSLDEFMKDSPQEPVTAG